MGDFQAEKDLVRRFHADIAQAGPGTIAEARRQVHAQVNQSR